MAQGVWSTQGQDAAGTTVDDASELSTVGTAGP